MGDVFEYISAVVRHWYYIVSGGAVIFLLGMYERVRDKAIRWKLYSILLGLLVLHATFLAWADQREIAINEQKVSAGLRGELSRETAANAANAALAAERLKVNDGLQGTIASMELLLHKPAPTAARIDLMAKERARRRVIREGLAILLDGGHALKLKCRSETPLPKEEADAWLTAALRRLLELGLDSSYVARLKAPRPVGRLRPEDVTPVNMTTWNLLNGLTETIRAFMEEYKD